MSKNQVEIWEKCLKVIHDNVPIHAFKTWFEPIIPVKLEKNTLTIQVPSHFFYEWLEEHYIDLLRKVITKEIGPDTKLEYSIVMENSDRNSKPFTVKLPTANKTSVKNTPMNMPLNLSDNPIKNPFIIPGLRKINIESNLNPIYTFDNYVEGDCNRLARSAGLAVAEKPGGTTFNPLFIYGNVGLGKTHLLHAIGIEIKRLHPNKTVLYVAAEQFGQQFVHALENRNINDFVHFYQMIDVLIVDDVQFFSGKEKTQDVFFNIFNHLQQNGNQIILSSDKAPIDIPKMEQRLLSRFKWGLSADITVPDLETRTAILQKKMYNNGIEFPSEVVEYLSYSVNTNIRDLEGAFKSLLAQASFNKKKITIDLAKQMIDKFVKNTAREVSIDYIQKVVSDYFDLSIDKMKSKTRKREVVQARQISMFLCKKFTNSSLANIGAQSGGKDHATVLHACRTVENLADTDKQFKKYLDDLMKKLTLQ